MSGADVRGPETIDRDAGARRVGWRRLVAPLFALGVLVGACGGSDAASDDGGDAGAEAPADAPTVVVSSNILGDVVESIAGDDIRVVTLMPVGVDPHEFQASAQQVAELNAADALIVNGGGFEEGLLDVIEAAEGEGVPTFEALSAVSAIEYAEDGGHDDHDHSDEEHSDEEDHDHAEDEEHSDEDHDDHAEDEEHAHDHEGVDPHFFTDPARMAVAVDAIGDFLAVTLDGVDVAGLEERTAAYVAELESLDAELVEMFEALDDEQRVLVTNHEVFGYFAERYGFEVVGAVIPSGSTADGASAAALAELAEVIEHEGVPAIFSDESASDELVATLADEVGDISIVPLYSETLGAEGEAADTYVGMVRTNAERIADALG